MVAATARVVVLMTPDEKLALDDKARKSGGISAAELVRRAVAAYDFGDRHEAEELSAVLDLFRRTRAETLAQLDRTDRKLDETLAALGREAP
jgi:hypothetical protein